MIRPSLTFGMGMLLAIIVIVIIIGFMMLKRSL
jgi:hypothetical protein